LFEIRRPFKIGVLWLMLGGGLTPLTALAHGFGARYQLEIPLYYYVLGAGLAVSLSFLIAALFLTRKHSEKPGFFWCYQGPGREMLSQAADLMVPVLQMFSVALFLLIIGAGFLGLQSPMRNLAPVLVWSVWWVGMVYIQALIGDLWRLVNPWNILFAWGEKIPLVRSYSGRLGYPGKLSCWPGVFLFWLFAWLEQVAPFAERPASLACLVLAYSLLTWLGMFLFGRETWLKRGEVFSIIFSFLARMAPIVARPEIDSTGHRLWVRPFGVGLLVREPLDRAATSLLLILLATVTFDGFRDTEKWAEIVHWLLAQPRLFQMLFALQKEGMDLLVLFETLGLLITPVIFFISYRIICGLSARLTDSGVSTRDWSGLFILTLVPISFAYHIAHYLTFLLVAGQLAIPLFSDPFNMGWDLLGTGGRQLDLGIIGIGATWWVAVGAVVIGHVYAVYLAHVMALRNAQTTKKALIGQMPLILLMIGYTMMSLWILAQPIVQGD
tara:strand:- start:8552 stop:10042 length:1491 start_codon:yes stop_codon:yes gene_type:complete